MYTQHFVHYIIIRVGADYTSMIMITIMITPDIF